MAVVELVARTAAVLLVLYGAWSLLWGFIRKQAIKDSTIMSLLPQLGSSGGKVKEKIKGTAVIAGGSFGGFATARVLADYFEKVVIIEPDLRLQLNGTRVQQRGQLHQLITPVCLILRKLFVNFDKEANSEDILTTPGSGRFLLGTCYLVQHLDKFHDVVAGSRLSLEGLVRRLTIEYCGPALEVRKGLVTGLTASADNSRIESVQYKPSFASLEDTGVSAPSTPAAVATQELESVESTLFVDASGSYAIAAKMLPATSSSWGPYPKSEYNPKLAYRGLHVTVPEKLQKKLMDTIPKDNSGQRTWEQLNLIFFLSPTPEVGQETFGLQRVNGNQIHLLSGGWGTTFTVQNFAQYRERLEISVRRVAELNPTVGKEIEWISDFFDVLMTEVEGIEDIRSIPAHYGGSQKIEYAKAQLPDNFAAVGDAQTKLNPAYGQGTYKALSNVAHLDTLLRSLARSSPGKLPTSFSKAYFGAIGPMDQIMYDLNKFTDYGFPDTIPSEGETTEKGSTFRNYFGTMLNYASVDKSTAHIVEGVLYGVRPGLDLFHPVVVIKSLLYSYLH